MLWLRPCEFKPRPNRLRVHDRGRTDGGRDALLPELRKAHHKLDAAVDALYERGGFASDRERVEHLFMLYERLISPLTASAGKAKRKKR